MPLSHEHVESKIPAKIQIYILTRAELLITLCYEIPCTIHLTWNVLRSLLLLCTLEPKLCFLTTYLLMYVGPFSKFRKASFKIKRISNAFS